MKELMVEDRSGDTLLYAGDLKVRITDWFFFKKNIELKYIGIENAIIKLQRHDSAWRHQFFVDYFSSPSSASKRKSGIAINLKSLELKQVTFIKKDAWLGKDMVFEIGGLILDAKEISFSKKIVSATSLLISEPRVSLLNYAGLKPRSLSKPEDVNKDSLLQWNPDGWVMSLDKLIIGKGTFINKQSSSNTIAGTFNGRDIEFNTIDADLSGIKWNQDTITAHLSIKTKERSGLEVKHFFADFKTTPQNIVFNNLDIQTNKSAIKDYFMISYESFDNMGDFIHKVGMSGNFKETEIDSDDIAFFAPALKTWKKKFTLRGRVSGTIDNLAGKDLVIQAGNNTLLNGNVSLTGLPVLEETFIDFTANDFKTNYSDITTFIPKMRQVKYPDLKKLGTIQFKGSFTGFIRDFVTDGTIHTNLGSINTDINMKLPFRQQPIYSGTISTSNFRLGEFLEDPLLGSISMNGVVKGTGFNEKNRNVNLKGDVYFFDYNKYRYSNITVNGTLNKLLFDGLASINDPNLDLKLNGLFDLNRETSAFDVKIDVNKANLQKINLVEKDISLKGKFKLNFTGGSIDEFIGKAKVTEATLNLGTQRLPFDSLNIISQIENGEKKLTIQSNEFDGNISGHYSIKDLPDAFRLFLSKYYPAYVKSPVSYPKQQSFTFEFNTRNVADYLSLIDKDLSGFDYSQIRGRLNLSENILQLDASIPNFSYRQFVFSEAEISGKGTLEKLMLKGTTGNIIINDSLYLPQSGFTIESAQDISKVNISTTANQPINKANINATVETFRNGVLIRMDSSSFSLNGKPWQIEKNGRLDFRRESDAEGQLVLRSGEQEIRLQTEPSASGNWNDLTVLINKVNLGDFSPFILPKNRLEGVVTGTAKIEDPFRKFKLTSDILAEQLLLDNDSLGTLSARILYDDATGLLTGNGKNLDTKHKFDFDLNLFLKDKEKFIGNSINVQTENYPINILERFLRNLFTDVHGYITGPLKMTGPLNALNFTGKTKLKDAGLKVKFTQCYYKIQDTEIELKDGEINLNGIVLTDPVTGNPVYLRGSVLHHSFRNMFFDVTASTRKPYTTDPLQNKPILLINTTAKDNSRFYGRAFGTGLFTLTGPESELFMKIDAIASNKDSSYVTIPSSSNKESGIADFLVERKYGREMNDLDLKKSAANIIYDVDLVITPAVNLKVVLDAVTNDEIKGRGEGSLSIHSGTSEPLKMRGRFNIIEGSYLFTFQSFFKRPFELRKGSDNYIEWIDDPYDARIHFDAVFKADKVSFAPLVTALNLDPSLNRYREDVYVVANLSGNLFSPDFEFKLEFPPNSKARNDPSLNFNIQQMEKNPNLINRQVTYLIVFNSFAPLETGTATGGGFGTAINEFVYSTLSSSISGIIFNQVNREMNKALSKILKTDNVSINFSGSVYNRNLLDQQRKNSFNINQGNLNINLPISFFKDRFIISLGSTLDVQLQSTIEQNIKFLPDVSAEWLINQSGTVRATFFYRQDLDILTSTSSGALRTKRSGASISYRKEFDRIRDLFRSKKRKKQEQDEPMPVNGNGPG